MNPSFREWLESFLVAFSAAFQNFWDLVRRLIFGE